MVPPYPRYRPLRVCQVQPDIDVLARECLHAAVVVLGPVDAVDADGVGAHFLDQPGVDLALPGVYEGVGNGGERVRDTWRRETMKW